MRFNYSDTRLITVFSIKRLKILVPTNEKIRVNEKRKRPRGTILGYQKNIVSVSSCTRQRLSKNGQRRSRRQDKVFNGKKHFKIIIV